MNESIVIAAISLVGTIIGSASGVIAAMQLIKHRLKELERKVDRHNNIMERVFIIEKSLEDREEYCGEKFKALHYRLNDMKSCLEDAKK